jgi:hypothetical protein
MAGRTSSRPSTGANTRFVSLITMTGYVSGITITNDSLLFTTTNYLIFRKSQPGN